MNAHDNERKNTPASQPEPKEGQGQIHGEPLKPDTIMRVDTDAIIQEPAGPAKAKTAESGRSNAASSREKARAARDETDAEAAPRQDGHDRPIEDEDLVSATDSAAFADAVRDEPAEETNGNPDAAGDAAANGLMDGPETLEQLRAERDGYLDLARRERADFDNYRKRVEREMRAIKRESLADFLKEFFGPLDDMDRVLQESVKNHSFESLVTGVRIMEENFWRVLAKAGVRKIDAKGKQFDPNLHEAMMAVPSADVPPGTVMEVYDNGYKLDEFILRPARVVVSRPPEE